MMNHSSRSKLRSGLVITSCLLLLSACGEEQQARTIAVEYPAQNETDITRDLIKLTELATIGARDEAVEDDPSARKVLRFNQPIHIGCLRADFSVQADLPGELKVGLFSNPQTYPTWIRFANATNQPDTEKDFRGMSLKLMHVGGDKLLGQVTRRTLFSIATRFCLLEILRIFEILLMIV